MKGILKFIKEEILLVIPAIIYFCIAFNLIFFTIGLSLRPGSPRYLSYLSVTIMALAAGKIILIVDALPFINAFPKKPLIYNISWKFFIFATVIFLVSVADNLIELRMKHGSFALAFQYVSHELSSPLFWSGQIWLFLTFLIYIIFSEFNRAVGRGKIIRMLLKRPD